MPTTLITGANRGLGFEFARQYAADGWRVIATCRDPKAVPELAEMAEVHALDIADGAQVAHLARTVDVPIDLLLNNAGIYGLKSNALGALDYEVFSQVLDTNVIGTLRMTETFRNHVARSDLRRVASITSKMGSIADNTSGGAYAYRASKAGLNAAMKSVAIDLAPEGIVSVVLHPGWVRTDMGGAQAPLAVEDSVAGMRRVIASLTTEDAGRFINWDGTAIPW